MFVKYATAVGLHNPDSKKLEDKLTPHCCRHYYTNTLDEADMKKNYIAELRGDKGRDAVDIYTHISKEKLKKSYMDLVPKLGL